MADAPNLDAPHLHLFDPHLLARARADAARTGTALQVWCVICGGATAISPAAAPGPALGAQPVGRQGAGGLEQVAPHRQVVGRSPHQEVRGLVVVAAPTTSRGMVRLRVGDVVVFASHASGHAEALRAAAARGDHVRVAVEQVGGDLYVRELTALACAEE